MLRGDRAAILTGVAKHSLWAIVFIGSIGRDETKSKKEGDLILIFTFVLSIAVFNPACGGYNYEFEFETCERV